MCRTITLDLPSNLIFQRSWKIAKTENLWNYYTIHDGFNRGNKLQLYHFPCFKIFRTWSFIHSLNVKWRNHRKWDEKNLSFQEKRRYRKAAEREKIADTKLENLQEKLVFIFMWYQTICDNFSANSLFLGNHASLDRPLSSILTLLQFFWFLKFFQLEFCTFITPHCDYWNDAHLIFV